MGNGLHRSLKYLPLKDKLLRKGKAFKSKKLTGIAVASLFSHGVSIDIGDKKEHQRE